MQANALVRFILALKRIRHMNTSFHVERGNKTNHIGYREIPFKDWFAIPFIYDRFKWQGDEFNIGRPYFFVHYIFHCVVAAIAFPVLFVSSNIYFLIEFFQQFFYTAKNFSQYEEEEKLNLSSKATVKFFQTMFSVVFESVKLFFTFAFGELFERLISYVFLQNVILVVYALKMLILNLLMLPFILLMIFKGIFWVLKQFYLKAIFPIVTSIGRIFKGKGDTMTYTLEAGNKE